MSYDGDSIDQEKPARSLNARQGRLQLRSVLCKPLSLVEHYSFVDWGLIKDVDEVVDSEDQ